MEIDTSKGKLKKKEEVDELEKELDLIEKPAEWPETINDPNYTYENIIKNLSSNRIDFRCKPSAGYSLVDSVGNPVETPFPHEYLIEIIDSQKQRALEALELKDNENDQYALVSRRNIITALHPGLPINPPANPAALNISSVTGFAHLRDGKLIERTYILFTEEYSQPNP